MSPVRSRARWPRAGVTAICSRMAAAASSALSKMPCRQLLSPAPKDVSRVSRDLQRSEVGPARGNVFIGYRSSTADNRSRHQISHRPCKHGAQTQPGKIVTPVRRQCADAANLHPDRAEVGKPTQRKGRDRKGAEVERRLLRPQQRVRHQLVGHRACSQKIAHLVRAMPGNPNQPGDGSEEEPEDHIQAGREGNMVAAQPVVDAPQHPIQQPDQRQK